MTSSSAPKLSAVQDSAETSASTSVRSSGTPQEVVGPAIPGQSQPDRSSSTAEQQVGYVGRIFDEMADEYDNLRDSWYRHTFGAIDEILLHNLRPSIRTAAALDVGCGTGIQSLRLASIGYQVLGIDIAPKLLAVAKHKLEAAGHQNARFVKGDAQAIPAPAAAFEGINCCGPTLSLVPDWRKALAEMSRCLKPGGWLLLEVEGKWNPDLFWEVINGLGLNFLGYDEPLTAALKHLLPPWCTGHLISYAFKLESGQTVSMPLKLFTPSEMQRHLRDVGLVVERRWGLHCFTNLIPSTILHEPAPPFLVRRLFSLLASMEGRVNHLWPVNAFACSLVFLARKTPGALPR
jgi:ubiquinone/menaquinone biosynthesis C-methylase UbiE